MKYVITMATIMYTSIAIMIFAMHTQMPVTFWLAVVRSVLWPSHQRYEEHHPRWHLSSYRR